MRVHWIWVVSTVLAYPVCALADEALGSQDAAMERFRIDHERRQASAALSAQEQQCYSGFMVNACLNDVAARRNEVMSNLKRQETKLDDAQRMQRGQELRQQLAEKMQERRTQNAQAAESAAMPLADKHEARRTKQTQHQQQPQQRKLPETKIASGVGQAVLEERRAAHLQKLKETEARRLERDKRVRESKPVQALPL